MAYIDIDKKELEKYIRNRPEGVTKCAEMIGRGKTYFHHLFESGRMQENSYEHMCDVFGVPHNQFLRKEEEVEVSTKDGYWISLLTKPDRVKVTLYFSSNGADIEVAHAWSKVKGDREVDLVQAISYAAHMCYKIVEQNELGK